MPRNHNLKIPAIRSFSGNTEERKRAIYLLTFLISRSEAMAREASGLCRKTHQRIITRFIERGHAFDAERSGRPVVYTEAIMERAYELLTNIDTGLVTGQELKGMLINEGLLAPDADRHAFMEHLRKYILSQGHRLITNSVKTTFFLTLTDIVDRLKYARMWEERLKAPGALDSVIFVDEVTLEEHPHPKGVTPMHEKCLWLCKTIHHYINKHPWADHDCMDDMRSHDISPQIHSQSPHLHPFNILT